MSVKIGRARTLPSTEHRRQDACWAAEQKLSQRASAGTRTGEALELDLLEVSRVLGTSPLPLFATVKIGGVERTLPTRNWESTLFTSDRNEIVTGPVPVTRRRTGVVLPGRTR